jgi:hypothetical protein
MAIDPFAGTTIDDLDSRLNRVTESKGSVYINNSSYSGADIQLVVHIYDANIATKDKKDEIDEELRALDLQIIQIQETINTLTNKIASVKEGSPESYRYITQQNKKEAELTSLQSSQVDLTNRLKSLELKQNTTQTKVLAEAQSISISTLRDKKPIRSCGRVYPKSYTRGGRTVGGTIVFTVFNESVLYELLEAHPSDFDAGSISSALIDQMPPMDITIAFANEYGQISRMGLLGVEFIAEGQVMSIEDIITENVCHFVARDIDPMRSVAQRKLQEETNIMIDEWTGVKGSDLLLEDDYQNSKTLLDPFYRFKIRNSPFK